MARRSLSMQGRIVAAGVSVAVGGALVGLMAAGDHTASASSNTSSSSNSSSSDTSSSSSASTDTGGNGGATATPYDGNQSNDGGNGFPGDNGGFSTQPQTRTGGS